MIATPEFGIARLYVRTASSADRNGWSVERDVAWYAIDRRRAFARPEILAALRDAALIESHRQVDLSRLLTATWDDIDASVVLTLDLYEGFKHFHALRCYLDAIRHEPAITDEELVELRRAQEKANLPEDGLVQRLVELMLSAHLAHYCFRRLGEQATEPVLAELLSKISADKARHAQSASDLIARRIEADRSIIPRVIESASNFHDVGERTIGTVRIANAGDPIAMQTFARRIERLCGVRLVDHIRGSL